MSIPEDTIRQVRESTDIVEIISEHVSLQKKGSANYFGLCPFHEEKTPSFSVHSTRQTYHCFGCGEGGNVFNFLMKVEGLEFPDAVRRLAERTGITINEQGQKKQTGETEVLYQASALALKYFRYRLTDMQGPDIDFARKYLEDRGISNELAETFQIGLAPTEWDGFLKVATKRGFSERALEKAGLVRRSDKGKYYDWFRGRLMFPIFNAGNRVVAFGGRILQEEKDRPQPKYINTQDTPIYNKGRLVYGLTHARDAMRQENTAILVEGYTDLIAMHKAGFKNTIAGLGTALTPDQASMIKKFASKAVLLYDSDFAGDNAAFRGADILIGANLEVSIALLPEGEDPDTLVEKGGDAAIREVLDKAESLTDYKLNYHKRRGALTSPQEKSEAIHSLIETIKRINDPITRQFTIHEVAEKLNVDEYTLSSELQKAERSTYRPKEVAAENNGISLNYFEEMLYNLLWVMVNYPEKRGEVFSFFKTSDLGSHPLKKVFSLLEASHIEGGSISEADLYNTLATEDSSLSNKLGQILNRPDPSSNDYVDTIIRDAPRAIRNHGIREELNKLKQAIKSNSAGKNAIKRYQKLTQELNEQEEE